MNEMFKKVNGSFPHSSSLSPSHTHPSPLTAREKLIGWYHTGPKLRASDLEINEVIKRYTPKPVMVIVDVRPDLERGGGGIPTDAYFAVEEIKDVSVAFSFFIPLDRD
jgi:proteasome lid subunit RPN8/RPN11